MEHILNCCLKQADSAEIIYAQRESMPVKFESNKLKCIRLKQTEGIGLRVIHHGQIGFSSTTAARDTASNPDRIDKLITYAMESASFGQEARFVFPSQPETLKDVCIFDKETALLSDREIKTMGEEIIACILEKEPDIQCGLEINRSISTIRILNSSGLDVSYEKSHLSVSVEGLLVSGQSLIWVFDGEWSCKYSKELLSKIPQKIIDVLSLTKKDAVVKTGQMPVIFTPHVVSMLLEPIELGLNGKMVQKGVSPLGERIGQKIVDSRLNIMDDATIDFASNSCPIDGEGVSTSKSALIENGILKRHLFDLQTAGLMNSKSTGNGYRSFDSLPSPHCSNLVVQPGEMSLDKMIKQMKNGLIVQQVIGGGQGNVLAGEFSVNVDLGFKVENGEIVGRIKDTMIAGNVYETLNHLIEIGSEASCYDSILAPPLWVDGVSVVSE
ncbi:MAG: TldD/PmbA family protein [bacterium]